MRKLSNLVAIGCFALFGLQAEDACGSYNFGLDWLYWKVDQENMNLGVRYNVKEAEKITLSGKLVQPDFDYQNGIRAYAGYTTEDQQWSTTLTYTYLPSNQSLKSSFKNGEFISSNTANFNLLAPLELAFFDAKMKWNARINYIDLDVERRLVFCDDLEIVPHIGVRGQWFWQKGKISNLSSPHFKGRLENLLNGIGIEGGCWGSWNLPYGLSIVGHFGGSLVYCRLQNTGKLLVDELPINIEYDADHYLSNVWVDSFLGITYSRCLDCFVINFHAGWEHHLVFNANHFSLGNAGNITMQGLTLGATLEF